MKFALPVLTLALLVLCAPAAMGAPACDPLDFAIVTDCTALPVGISGQTYTAQITSAGCDTLDLGGGGGIGGGCSVFWSAAGLPTGLNISPMGESTVITGTPSVTGDFAVTIMATDMNALNGLGCETTCTGTITVVADVGSVPPGYIVPGNNQRADYVPGGADGDVSGDKCMISAAGFGLQSGAAWAGLLALTVLAAAGMRMRK